MGEGLTMSNYEYEDDDDDFEEDDEEGKTAELAHAASQMLTLYMGEEAASDYFWSVSVRSASGWHEWAE